MKNQVNNYSEFVKFHSHHFGGDYNVPSLKQVKEEISLFGLRQYDEKKDCWFFYAGEYHPQPGSRIEFTWNDVAIRYAQMYSDFGNYGTN